MVLRGHIQNGIVQFDEPVTLPEGAAVRVELLDQALPPQPPQTGGISSIESQIAGIWKDLPQDDWKKLPADLSDNLDHYLYGTPKR